MDRADAARRNQVRDRAVACARALAALALLALAGPAPARAQVFSEELRRTGFWPDLALALGGGIGLGHSLDTNVLGRARLGALYAYEPLIVNLGISADLGALAGRGIGVELELNHFGGPFLQAGLDRVTSSDWMTHVMLGLSLFGVEWQHRMHTIPDDALLFVLRVPIGIWWFLLAQDARAPPRRPARGPAEAPAR